MLEILNYSFMVRAILAGVLIALVVPLIGGFLVAKKYSLIADSLAHSSLAGVGAGLLLGLEPVVIALPVAILGAIIVEYLRQKKGISGETSLAILMSGGLAIAVVLANLASGVRTDFNSYLFGSITTTSWNDVYTLSAVVILIATIVFTKYKSFLYIAFDEDSAKIAGINVAMANYVLVSMTAIIVVLSLRIVGGLLISALIVLPIVSAARLTKNFKNTIRLSIVLALIAVLAGLVSAFYVGIAAGGAIVLCALGMFIITLIVKH